MPAPPSNSSPFRLSSAAGGSVEITTSGSLRRFDFEAVSLLLFIGGELESGPANVYLRRRGAADGRVVDFTPLLGPASSTQFQLDPDATRLTGSGSWMGLDYRCSLVLAQRAPVWFWHVSIENRGASAQQLDLTYAHDVALAPYGAVRMNEYFVSQYLDHTPLQHPKQGVLIASRQNQAVDGRHPWCLIGSLRRGVSFATDALQLYGLASRAGLPPPGLRADLPSRRLQHEHALAVLRDAPLSVDPGASVTAGFFGIYEPDHPAASSGSDLDRIERLLALPEAAYRGEDRAAGAAAAAATRATPTLFGSAPLFDARELDEEELQRLFPPPWQAQERDASGKLLSFFYAQQRHVVLRAKELQVLRPHGQLLRSGRHITPAECALTSTVWMNGVFHSMVTQGHVNINRLLSTVHGYLALFRSQGQRVFVQRAGAWRLLDVPSAFEMEPLAARWIYRDDEGVIEVCSRAHSDPHALSLSIQVYGGAPVRFLISHQLALGGDDGAAPTAAAWQREADSIRVTAPPQSELGRRFPSGCFRISVLPGTQLERVGADELLFADAQSRGQPYLCLLTTPALKVGLLLQGELLEAETQQPLLLARPEALIPNLTLAVPAMCAQAEKVARLAEWAPWLAQNALVHYLAPRGLEQYSGGGWGTRDVCQGPIEMLRALGHTPAIREVLLRVMAAQNGDGDWPQWFMFFERERLIRAGDAHGDIVFWPLVVLAQYLLDSGDGAVLDERVPFFDARGADTAEQASVWEHAQRALELIGRRVIGGTVLAAYGHGDWNDSLQPLDPDMRAHMCSAWTVTLQVQMLNSLARALRLIGRTTDALELERQSQQVRQDFQRLLLVDGVLTGYAIFESGGEVRYLLHPRDDSTGVYYSALAMIHAILEDVFTPIQARAHLRLLEDRLSGPDGVRLFDRPLPYHGGTQRLFQRAETATFFGREIGLMYTHAHLRYAQALAHLGEAERFFHALCQANPIGITELVPSATPRQANCYYSSSDAAFQDRYQASIEYQRVARGAIALDGGWRVYSSGAGIALSLLVRHFLGLSGEAAGLRIDPVMPSSLDGLRAQMTLLERSFELHYRVGPAGCGVKAVALNGAALTFARVTNPHRPGAALVAHAALQERLSSGTNTLSIELG
jgi:cellobiose phosphorylase